MEKSESIAELAAALAEAQQRIEGAIKDSVNPHLKSKYADLASVVAAIRPALAGTGLSFVQVSHDIANAAKVETFILHKSGQYLSAGAVSVPVSKNDAQGFGSALTYARRYSLSAAFGVTPEDDDGHAAAAAAPQRQKPSEKIDPEKVANQRMDLINAIKSSSDMVELQRAFKDASEWGKTHKQYIEEIVKAKDEAKTRINAQAA